jgi:myosin-crossreactive antigen
MAKMLIMVEDLDVEVEDLGVKAEDLEVKAEDVALEVAVEVDVIATAGTLISQSVIGMMKLRSARKKWIM